MKRSCKALCLGLALACLAGCGAQSTPEPTVDPFTADLTAGKTITSAGSGDYVTTEAGIYELQAVFPRSVSLFYTDAATRERDFVCPDPDCEHADESCPSYIPAPPEMYPPVLLRIGDQLLVVFTENFGDSVPHAILMNMDGSEKRTVFEFSDDQSIPGTFCTTGNDLFFVLRDFSAPGNTPDQLWYANFENDSLGKVMDLADGDRKYSLCDDCPAASCAFVIPPPKA